MATRWLFRQIKHLEFPFNLTNDMNFDICFGGPMLMTFISTSHKSSKIFTPKLYIYYLMGYFGYPGLPPI